MTSDGRRQPPGPPDDGIAEVDIDFPSFRHFQSMFQANLSREGLFIPRHDPLPTSSVVRFRVRLPDDFVLLEGVGVVCWTREQELGPDEPSGMAVRFASLAPQSQELIDKLVDTYVSEGGQPFELEPTGAGEDVIPTDSLAGRAPGPAVKSPVARPQPGRPGPAGARGSATVRLKVRSAADLASRGGEPAATEVQTATSASLPPPPEPAVGTVSAKAEPPLPFADEPTAVRPRAEAPGRVVPEAPAVQAVIEPFRVTPEPEAGLGLEGVGSAEWPEPAPPAAASDSGATAASSSLEEPPEDVPKVELELDEAPVPVVPDLELEEEPTPVQRGAGLPRATFAQRPASRPTAAPREEPLALSRHAEDGASPTPPPEMPELDMELLAPAAEAASRAPVGREEETRGEASAPRAGEEVETLLEAPSQRQGSRFDVSLLDESVPEAGEALPSPAAGLPPELTILPRDDLGETPRRRVPWIGLSAVVLVVVAAAAGFLFRDRIARLVVPETSVDQLGTRARTPLETALPPAVVTRAPASSTLAQGEAWTPSERTAAAAPAFSPTPAAVPTSAPVPTPVPTSAPVPTPVPTPLPLAPATRVEEISWSVGGGGTTVMIRGDGAFSESTVAVIPMTSPPRILVRLRPIETKYPRFEIKAGSPELEQIRVGFHPEQRPPSLYVVLDLKGANVAVGATEIDGREVRLTLTRR